MVEEDKCGKVCLEIIVVSRGSCAGSGWYPVGDKMLIRTSN